MLGKRTYEQIDHYLEGRLSDKEKSAFEKQINADKELADEINVYKAVNELIIDHEIIALKAKINARYQGGKTKFRNSYYRYIYIPGLILVAAFAVYMWQEHPSQMSESMKNKPLPKGENVAQKSITKKKDSVETIQSVKPVIKHKADLPKSGIEDTSSYLHNDVISIGHSSKTFELMDNEVDEVVNESESEKMVDLSPIKEIKGISSTVTERPANIQISPVEKEVHLATEESLPCEFDFGLLSIQTKSSCNSNPEGSISLKWTSEQPDDLYQFAIDQSNYQSSLQFNDLYPGVYHLQVKDQDGCIAGNSETIIINQKSCSTEYQDAFNPMRGETWKIPVGTSQSAHVNIYDRSGILVISFSVRNGQPAYWNGRDGRSVILPTGSYTFVILESNHKIFKKGQVTIIR